MSNAEQYEHWNGETGERWVADADGRDRALAQVGEILLEAAAAQPGEAVLDVGCGCGVTTLALGAAVGTEGSVTGLDLSGPMLGLAERRRQDTGLTNVEFVQGDAQVQPFDRAYDMLLSRFGTMFFADPVAAFTNLAGALRHGGRVCLATWRPMAENPWLTVPFEALPSSASVPETVAGPGMFAQSEPDRVREVLEAAGLTDVELRSVDTEQRLGTVEEATAYLVSSSVGRAVMATVDEGEHDAAMAAVADSFRRHEVDGEVLLGGGIWIVTARRGNSRHL